MKQDFFYPSLDGRTQIHAIEWIPEGEPRAVIQFCHGMIDHIARYGEFAQYLCDRGYYVVGNDHLGHGQSVATDADHGFFHETRGNECIIEDVHSLRKMTAKRYPNLPYFFMGHSMGSFVLRQYIEMYGEGLKGAIIMGTGHQPTVIVKFAKILSNTLRKLKGERYTSKLIDSLAIEAFNKRFEPARTSNDWLSRREENVDAYLADPWCTFRFTVNAYYFMFCGIDTFRKAKNMARIPKNLPLLVVSGREDPVGDFGKGVEAAYKSYVDQGIRDVTLRLYDEDRHEILNEVDREMIFGELYDWLEERM